MKQTLFVLALVSVFAFGEGYIHLPVTGGGGGVTCSVNGTFVGFRSSGGMGCYTPLYFSDGTNIANEGPGFGTPSTCAGGTVTINFSTLAVVTQKLILTASVNCTVTLAGLVVGQAYVLRIVNATSSVLSLPGSVDFGYTSYTPSMGVDSIGLLVLDSTPHIQGSVMGTGYAN